MRIKSANMYEIFVKSELDREIEDVYYLVVEACDNDQLVQKTSLSYIKKINYIVYNVLNLKFV